MTKRAKNMAVPMGPVMSLKERMKHPFLSRMPGGQVISNCTQKWKTQYLDHFNWRAGPKGQTTYQERYFVCGGRNWSPGQPIWFYTGNEANVELYLNATGLMWENADDFNAIMVFAEHRYFGESVPFPDELSNDNLVFLSSDQAMADYATLIRDLKTEWNSWDSPVIGFGGSYGGMLCSWFRIKYPQWMQGCIAGSAPIVAFEGQTPPVNPDFFADIVSTDCTAQGGANDMCAYNLENSWAHIFTLSETQSGRDELADIFRTCGPISTYDEGYNVANWVNNALGDMAMGSYPYPSSYMVNGGPIDLPPYPLRVGCNNYLKSNLTGDYKSLLAAVRDAAGVYYNYTHDLDCFDINAAGNNQTDIDGELWEYLYCTEIFMPFGQQGPPEDIFWSLPWNTTENALYCAETYENGGPRIDWAEINYGGWQIASSNIVFSNGGLDPWRGAGITRNLSSSLPAIIIPDLGHHADLFFSNPMDTQGLVNARLFELKMIQEWTNEHFSN